MKLYMTEKDVARVLNISVHTLQKHRQKGIGIPFIKMGRLVRYRTTEFEAYIQQHRVDGGFHA